MDEHLNSAEPRIRCDGCKKPKLMPEDLKCYLVNDGE